MQRRHGLRRQFDAQVAARHHHAIGQFDNLLQPLHGGGLFNLGHQRAMSTHQLARFGQILRPLYEAERDPVAPLLHREAKIATVLVRQGGHRHDDVGHIDALAIGEGAADFDDRVDTIVADRLHPQDQLAIVEQQPRLGHQSRIDFGMRQIDAARVAGRFIAVKDEGRALFQDREPLFEGADAQLWPLEIAQDGGRPVEFLFQRADRGDAGRMILMRAMAHIDAESVGPGDEQRPDHFGRIARGAKGRENAHLSRAGR